MRDGRGTPWVSDPAGVTVKTGKRQGEVRWVRYGRPSSFGKDIENTYNLDRWNERQIVKGIARATVHTVGDDTEHDPVPELLERLAKVVEADADTDDERDALDGVIVYAKSVAKAGLAAERGTHMHAVTEDDDTDTDWLLRAERGEILDVPVPVQAAMLEAWRLMLTGYDLEILGVEEKVVHDRWRQAGTLDRRVRLLRAITFANGVTLPAGTVLLLDVKTGRLRRTAGGVIEYWHSYAVQCATYADSVPYDTATDTRGEWPAGEEMNPDWAVIAHLPVDEAMAGTAVCRLVLVDIASARQVVEDVILPARRWQARTDLFALCHADEPCVEVAIEQEPVEDNLVEQLEESVAIARSIKHEFSATPPAPVDLHRAPVADEGEELTEDQRATIRAKVVELDPQARALLDSLAKAANAAGHPFSIAAGPNRRRWHIYRALLRLGAHFGADLSDDLIRATLALALPEAAQLGVALGPAIGSLTHDEAQRFVQAAIAVINSDPALHFDDTGAPTWRGVSLPAA